jgi:hypothetical protein
MATPGLNNPAAESYAERIEQYERWSRNATLDGDGNATQSEDAAMPWAVLAVSLRLGQIAVLLDELNQHLADLTTAGKARL